MTVCEHTLYAAGKGGCVRGGASRVTGSTLAVDGGKL